LPKRSGIAQLFPVGWLSIKPAPKRFATMCEGRSPRFWRGKNRRFALKGKYIRKLRVLQESNAQRNFLTPPTAIGGVRQDLQKPF